MGWKGKRQKSDHDGHQVTVVESPSGARYELWQDTAPDTIDGQPCALAGKTAILAERVAPPPRKTVGAFSAKVKAIEALQRLEELRNA